MSSTKNYRFLNKTASRKVEMADNNIDYRLMYPNPRPRKRTTDRPPREPKPEKKLPEANFIGMLGYRPRVPQKKRTQTRRTRPEGWAEAMKHPGLAGPEIEKPLRQGLRYQVKELVACQPDITLSELLTKLGRTREAEISVRNIADAFRSDLRFLYQRGNLRGLDPTRRRTA